MPLPAIDKRGLPAPVIAAGGRAGAVRGRSVAGLLVGVALVALLFAVRFLVPSSVGGVGMADAARDFATLSISVVIESLPFVFLGIVLSIAVQIWLPEGLLLRRLPRTPVLRRMVLSLLGMLLPVCECGNVPLARGLMVNGLTVAESMTFLFAAPILNPITIVTTQQAFGWDNNILVARIAGGFAIANLVGWLYSRHPRPADLLTPRFQAACALKDHHGGQPGKAARSVGMFVQETGAMMPALFIGAALAGIIQVAVSREVLVTLGSNPIWSVLALMLLAFVVAICSNVDAFFILSFGATFLPGAIVAFLVFGPMIDVKMLALLRTTFTSKTLVQLSVLVALCAAVLGLAVNYVH
ncbi:permease [Arthrobacter sp. PAMC25564]|uniref:permease n=1 Tax=Arthrobacter sp. PAMC25564 TaxID=2565366 RepID=UPI0010A270AA|nr:permease [Arthrobacter sp. PAMC25564]QCB95794.1 permease [Arthrobacter sp. PAMC25564]